jgi:hypothetical protein
MSEDEYVPEEEKKDLIPKSNANTIESLEELLEDFDKENVEKMKRTKLVSAKLIAKMTAVSAFIFCTCCIIWFTLILLFMFAIAGLIK